MIERRKSMSYIEDILAREVLDSRGNPTVEVEVLLEDGSFLQAHRQAYMKLWNSGTVTSRDISAREL